MISDCCVLTMTTNVSYADNSRFIEDVAKMYERHPLAELIAKYINIIWVGGV